MYLVIKTSEKQKKIKDLKLFFKYFRKNLNWFFKKSKIVFYLFANNAEIVQDSN